MIDFIIDLETLGTTPDAKVVDISVVPFDINQLIPFSDLVARGRKFKLDLKAQPGRTKDQATIDWWKQQSKEARAHLAPSDSDLTIDEAVQGVIDFLVSVGVTNRSQGWCRGMSFDFPIFDSLARSVDKSLPIKFFNQRDIRTAIEAYADTRGMTKTPLPKGVLEGFVHHNSIHDCAKDILMLQFARGYASGDIEFPEDDNIDPVTV